MHKKKVNSYSGFSPKQMLKDLRDGKQPETKSRRKHKKDQLSIELNAIELSDMSHSRRGSDLSDALLPSHEKKNYESKIQEELTIEEVIGKVFPEFMKHDEKTNKSKINWRHVDKSALKDIFGETGKKLLHGKQFLNKLTVPSQTFLHRDSDASEEQDPDADASHQLSYQKLLKYIEDNHPREDYVDKETHKRKKRLFNMNIPTGNYLAPTEPNHLENYGLGVTLYFKYVKYLIALFLALFMINLPALLIFFFNRNSYPETKSTDILNNILFKTTFGNIGGEKAICGKASYTSDDPNLQRLYFQCPENMRIVSFFGMAMRNTSNCKIPDETFNMLVQEDYVDDCEAQILANTKIEDKCNHEMNCTINVNMSTLPDRCKVATETFTSDGNVYLNGYAMCEEFYINFPGLRALEKKSIYYIFVVIDLCSVLLYTLGYFWIRGLEKNEEIRFKSNVLSSEQYTLKIAGCGKVQNIWEYLNDLIDHFQDNSPQTNDMTIADVNFVSFDKDYIDTKQQIGFTLRKIHTLEALIEKARKDNLDDKLINGMLELHYRCDEELQKYYKELEKIELNKPMKIKYIFLTFNKSSTAEEVLRKFYEPATKRTLARLHIYGSQEEWRYFKGTRLIVKRAPPASNIRWNAISASKFNIELRRIAIFTIEFLLIFACFYSLMFLQIQDNYYLSLLDKEECTKVYSQSDVLNNWDNKNILKCFCEQTFTGSLQEQLAASQTFTFDVGNYQCNTTDVPDIDPYYYYQTHSACHDYFSALDRFNGLGNWLGLQYGLKLSVATANGLIALVSLFFAKLMKRPTISSELKESMKGAFIMQMLTLGWLALLSNIDSFKKIWEYFTPQTEPLFRVMCKDFSIKFEGLSVFTLHWFFTSGTGLIMTLFLSAFTYQISVLLVYFAFRFYRWFDRGFTMNRKKTRQLIQSDYNKIYKGPIISLDNSYSNLLTFLFVVMMFAPALPILYLIAALAFTIGYWLDKYLQLRFYCNPPRLDERFAREMRRIVPYSILLHLAFAILIFGSYHLAPPSEANLHVHAGDFILVNETITQTTTETALVNDLFSDIVLFYRESMYQPFVSVLGFMTLAIFFVLIGKFFLWDLIKAAGRNIAAYKRIYTRKITVNLELDFVEAVETSYLIQKIEMMKKQQKNSCFTLEYEAKFRKILEMYQRELSRRSRRQTYTRIKQYIKDVPFYNMELSDDFRKEFGIDYTKRIEYTNDDARSEKWNEML